MDGTMEHTLALQYSTALGDKETEGNGRKRPWRPSKCEGKTDSVGNVSRWCAWKRKCCFRLQSCTCESTSREEEEPERASTTAQLHIEKNGSSSSSLCLTFCIVFYAIAIAIQLEKDSLSPLFYLHNIHTHTHTHRHTWNTSCYRGFNCL